MLFRSLVTMDGYTKQDEITVSSIAPNSPIRINATPLEGLIPLTITVEVSNEGDADAIVQWNGEGDYALQSGGVLLLTLEVSEAGAYPVTVEATNVHGAVTSRSFVFIAYDKNVLDQKIRALWGGLTEALVAGNKQQALDYFSAGAKTRYSDIFDDLINDFPEIIGSFSELQSAEITDAYGEYAINRMIDGNNKLFFIYFVKDGNGIWRIESM